MRAGRGNGLFKASSGWQVCRLTILSCAAIEFGAVPLPIHPNLEVVW